MTLPEQSCFENPTHYNDNRVFQNTKERPVPSAPDHGLCLTAPLQRLPSTPEHASRIALPSLGLAAGGIASESIVRFFR